MVEGKKEEEKKNRKRELNEARKREKRERPPSPYNTPAFIDSTFSSWQ